MITWVCIHNMFEIPITHCSSGYSTYTPSLDQTPLKQKRVFCFQDVYIRQGSNTVEPLNKGHFGSRGFVLFSEVVLWWEVQANRLFIDLIYLDNVF